MEMTKLNFQNILQHFGMKYVMKADVRLHVKEKNRNKEIKLGMEK